MSATKRCIKCPLHFVLHFLEARNACCITTPTHIFDMWGYATQRFGNVAFRFNATQRERW